MLSFLFLIALRVAWEPAVGAESYRVYFMRGQTWELVAEVKDNFLTVPLPARGTSFAAVSSIANEQESELSEPAAIPQYCDNAEEEIFLLRRTCGKKCSKVPFLTAPG